MTALYDSEPELWKHVARVRCLLRGCSENLEERAAWHDASKLSPEEKPVFDEFTPKLKDSTYGSDEYKGFLAAMKPALDHHYANNSHHPEHWPNGVTGMSLLDLIELLCDWKAAGERHANGSIEKSLEINKARFGIDAQLFAILRNTAAEMGWLTKET